MRRWMIPLLVLVMAAGVTVGGPAAAQEDGQAQFAKNCEKCHGPDGQADTKAGKKMKTPAWDDDTDLSHAHVIENVRTNKKHRTVSKKVSDAELDAIATYVATLGGS